MAVKHAQRGGTGIDEIKALTQHKVADVIGVYARHEHDKEQRCVVDLIDIQLSAALQRKHG